MGDTLSGATQISEATKSQALTTPGNAARSTVLPRVEWVGPNPRVNPTQRHRFEELGLLGEGGMGEVVLAQDHDIERQVALKRLPENADLGRVLRFVEEIRRTPGRGDPRDHAGVLPVPRGDREIDPRLHRVSQGFSGALVSTGMTPSTFHFQHQLRRLGRRLRWRTMTNGESAGCDPASAMLTESSILSFRPC